MAENRILPLGFIDRVTEDGAVMWLTTPSESSKLRLETEVTLTSRSVGQPDAVAAARGIITAIGYVTATFETVETQRATTWPENENVLRKGLPVYEAIPGTFIPDPDRTLTREQEESLGRLAARYRARSPRRSPRTAVPRRRPPRNGRHPDT